MSLKVLDPGPLTTVQDAGRTGYAAKGYRVCGAADSYAYRLGNMLIGNARARRCWNVPCGAQPCNLKLTPFLP